MFENLTWKCDIYKQERPDQFISVRKFDLSIDLGLSPGTVFFNVKFCNDRLDCTERSKTFDTLDGIRNLHHND